MTYFLCFIALVTVIIILIYFKFIDIRIRLSKSNDINKINVVDQSYIQTLQAFISPEDYKQIKGKIIFFTTWNSFCRGSIEGIPFLNHIQMRYSNNTKIVFASYCSDLKASSIDAFLKSRKVKMNFLNLTSKEGLRSSLRTILSSNKDLTPIDPKIDTMNMTFIVDAKDRILYYRGGGMTKEDLPLICSILD